MRTLKFFGTLMLVAGTLCAAEPKEEVESAAKALKEKGNYSWTTTSENVNQSRFQQGPTEGKAEKDGFVSLKITTGNNTVEAVLKDGKGAVKTPEGWKSLAELSESGDQNRRRFTGRMLQNFKAPAEQAIELAGQAQGLKKTDEGFAGDLSQDGIKQLLPFGRRRPDAAEAPPVRDLAGTVKFTVKDGVLTKYQYSVKATITFNNNDIEIDRTTTVEIKDVGTTKVDVPEEAKSKAS